MAVSRLCPLALAFTVASVIAISTVYTFINGYNDEDFAFRLKRNHQIIKRKVDKEAKLAHKRIGIRLPDHVLPLSYDIVIQPNLTTFKFLGDVKIELQCRTSTKNIIFHVRDIHLRDITLTDSKHNLLNITSRTFHSKYQQYVITTSEELNQGSTYTLQVMYHGVLSNNTDGFYQSSYRMNNGEKRYLAATQFEATSARSAFPCFDEPSFKALFRITVRHYKNHTALSNMPLESRDITHDGLTESRFLQSVPMSTYLVAFVVCDFEYKETNTKNGKKIRVWSRPDAINNTAFALDVAKHTLEYYENYFDVPNPLPKMDLIAIPDMGGAMENWGLVTFSESALLYDPTTGSAADQKLVAMIVDHELAHQWFGNLVTMEWWSDLWLNEGFAVFMEYLATDAYDSKWKREDQFLLDTLKNALDADSSVHTHPVSVKVQKPAQINEIVDQITYHKGSAIIRMLQSFLGEETFRKGIKLYLKEHQFSHAKASDLWRVLNKVSALDVKTIMDSWVTRKGFPVITLTSVTTQRKDGGLSCTASQKRFVRDYSALPLADNEQSAWYVPLTFITEDSPGSIRTIWMNSTSVAFQLGVSPVGWVKANVGQTGFYRVNYDEENWRQLIRQLFQNHTVLSPSDRSGLVDDALSLARAGLLDYKTALDMTEYLSWETEYIPWAVARRSLAYVGNMISGRHSYRLYQRYIIKKIKPLEQKLGWQDRGGMIDKFLRDLTLSTLCANGDAKAVNRTKSLFEDWTNNNGSHSGPAYLRKLVYHTAIQYGGDKEWRFLWMKYVNNENAAEREKIIFALSGSRKKDLLNRLLSFCLDKSRVRAQDAVQIITNVAGNTEGRNLAWEFYKRNFDKLVKRFGKESRAIVYLLERTTENMNTPQELLEVNQLVEKHRNMSVLRSTKKIQETIQSNIHWVSMYTRTIEEWFKSKAEKG